MQICETSYSKNYYDVNPQKWKIKSVVAISCNWMYIKLYIFEMEMSQRIHFENLLNISI